MSIADELQKLQQLNQSGAIDDDEFALAKAKVLSASQEFQPSATDPFEATGLSFAMQERQTRQWALFLHLSVLAGFVLPLAGLLAPIVIWQLKKAELPGIDVHGRNALNWIISMIIYFVLCVILVFVLIGIPMLVALGVVAIVFPIVAGIKANNGEVWKYPLAIPFLKGDRL